MNKEIKKIMKGLAVLGTTAGLTIGLSSCKPNQKYSIETNLQQEVKLTSYNQYDSTKQQFSIDSKNYYLSISDKHGKSWNLPSCEYIALFNDEGKMLAREKIEGGNLEDIIIKNIQSDSVEFFVTQKKNSDGDYLIYEGEIYFK